jgi:hypothetical protein
VSFLARFDRTPLQWVRPVSAAREWKAQPTWCIKASLPTWLLIIFIGWPKITAQKQNTTDSH